MSDTLSSDQAGTEMPETLRKIYETFEGMPVLLPIPRGEKGPTFAGWQKITYAQSRDPAHKVIEWRKAKGGEEFATDEKKIRQPPRAYPELLSERSAKGNLGVLLGDPSVLEVEGVVHHLCCIDIDDPEAVEPFVAANPALAFSLRIVGARGCKIFLWVAGIYQERKVPLMYLGADGQPPAGKDKAEAKQWGDWLATGAQAVVFGLHPSGVNYTATMKKPPARLKFEEIVWPENVHVPWRAAAEATQEQKEREEFAALIQQYGEAWSVSEKGKMTLNQTFFAAFFAKKHRVLYSPEEARFFRYQGDATGLWAEQTADAVRWELCADMKEIADETQMGQLINLRTTQLENAVLAKIRGAVERWEAFKRAISPKTKRARALSHLLNGMLDLDEAPPALLPFSADYMSRAQLAVALVAEADCPRFKKDLLESAIPDADDRLLLQKFAGQFLLGVNLSQMLPILTGTAGGGKSTLVNVFTAIIGERNVGQLRTEHLHERFEIFRMLNKTLLTGVDVPGNFLMSEGAYVIKGLVGGDLLDAEPKNGNQTFQVRGELNIIITCNSRLKVKLEYDADAWRRRLALIPFEMPPPPTPDPSFVQKLVASEGSGILNWMVEGAVMLLQDLADTGRIRMTAKQKARVSSLMAESDSVRNFARNGVRKAVGNKITSEQVSAAYVAYCERRGWAPMPSSVVERQLPDALLELYQATKSNDIKTDNDAKPKRGYRGIDIVSETKESTPDELL
jgi:P4 family phage/plasmid primase-like protien